jgi:hypothetical protein
MKNDFSNKDLLKLIKNIVDLNETRVKEEKKNNIKKLYIKDNESQDKFNNLKRFFYIIIFIILFIIALLLTYFNPNGLFTSKINTSMYISLLIFIVFFFLSTFIKIEYNKYQLYNKSTYQEIYNLRQRIFFISLFVIIIIVNLFIINPYNSAKNYESIYLFLLIISILLSFLTFITFTKNSKIFTTVNKKYAYQVIFQSFTIVLFYSFVLIGILMFFQFIFSIFNFNENNSTYKKVVNFLFLSLLIGLFFYGIDKYFKLNLLSYIKIYNLFDFFVNFIKNEYKNIQNNDILLLIIILFIYGIICLVYFFYDYFYKIYYVSGGLSLLNDSVKLNKEKIVASYLDIYDGSINTTTQKYNNYYKYAVSFWFYIDSNPPNTNKSYNEDTNIINYGYNPFVSYNPSTNTLKVSLLDLTALNKCINSGLEKQKCINKLSNVIYENKNFKLQKWNNMIFIFNSGTLDIFYNNNLVKSGIGIPNISSLNPLISGSNMGLNGKICNILYFKKSLDLELIEKLYNLSKNKNPPII